MKTLIVKNQEDFKGLEKEWDQLLSESKNNNIFLTFEWQYNWWKHFGKSYQLFIILVFDLSERLSGIFPLMERRIYGLRQLMFISSPLADYEGFIVSGGQDKKREIIGAFFKCLNQSNGWDMLKLTRMKEDLLDGYSFGGFKENLKIFLGQHKEGAPYLELSDDWENYCLGLKKKFLADTKRQSARLNGQGTDNFLFKKINSIEEIESYINKLAEFHRLRRKEKSTKSIFDNPVASKFIKSTAKIFLQKDRLALSVLQNSSVIAAINLGFKYKNVAYYYIPAFNDSFKQYSAGRLLLYELLRSSFGDSVAEFDFMLGEENYKNDWNAKRRKLHFINVYPMTVKGNLAYFIFSLLNIKLKKMFNSSW